MSRTLNDQIYTNYSNGKYASRFEFFCTVALQDPISAAVETERCVKKLGGVGVMLSPYTNIGSVNQVTYIDDLVNEPFWKKIEQLKVPVYLHPRQAPPDQQRVYQGFEFLAGSSWGYSMETGATALRLMLSGLFDRYPGIQIILGHCGEGLPFYLARIDQRLRHLQRDLWPAKRTIHYYCELINGFFICDLWSRKHHVLVLGIGNKEMNIC